METLVLLTCIITTNGQIQSGHVLIKASEQAHIVEQADQLCSESNPLYVPQKPESQQQQSDTHNKEEQ